MNNGEYFVLRLKNYGGYLMKKKRVAILYLIFFCCIFVNNGEYLILRLKNDGNRHIWKPNKFSI